MLPNLFWVVEFKTLKFAKTIVMKLLFHSFVLTICDYLFSTRTYRLLVEVSQG